jgi:hypothetical protein
VRVDAVWAGRGHANSLEVLISALLYSVQIYCDFSGYADIAIGTAKLLNVRLSRNFDYPYFSVGIRVFWRRPGRRPLPSAGAPVGLSVGLPDPSSDRLPGLALGHLCAVLR